MKSLSWLFPLLILAAGVSFVAAEPTYVGVDKCKLCHKVQHASWKELKHASAFDLLKPEERSNAECLRCHATGGSAEMPGVQCEACHGPGSEYKSMKVMKDQGAAVAAGLVLPTEATCKGCHENAPHEVPPFDFEARKAGGIHALKSDQ